MPASVAATPVFISTIVELARADVQAALDLLNAGVVINAPHIEELGQARAKLYRALRTLEPTTPALVPDREAALDRFREADGLELDAHARAASDLENAIEQTDRHAGDVLMAASLLSNRSAEAKRVVASPLSPEPAGYGAGV